MAQVKNGVSQEQDWKHIHVIVMKNNIEKSLNEMYSSTSLSFNENKQISVNTCHCTATSHWLYVSYNFVELRPEETSLTH